MQWLNNFLTFLGTTNDSMERKHVLIGQQFRKDKMGIQNDPVFVIARRNFDGELPRTLDEVCLVLNPAAEDFAEFHDLEDQDNNGGDDKEVGTFWWGPEDDVDEHGDWLGNSQYS